MYFAFAITSLPQATRVQNQNMSRNKTVFGLKQRSINNVGALRRQLEFAVRDGNGYVLGFGQPSL